MAMKANQPWNSLGKFIKSEAGSYAMGGAMIGGTYGYASDRDIYGPAMLGAGLGYGAYRFNAASVIQNAGKTILENPTLQNLEKRGREVLSGGTEVLSGGTNRPRDINMIRSAKGERYYKNWLTGGLGSAGSARQLALPGGSRQVQALSKLRSAAAGAIGSNIITTDIPHTIEYAAGAARRFEYNQALTLARSGAMYGGARDISRGVRSMGGFGKGISSIFPRNIMRRLFR